MSATATENLADRRPVSFEEFRDAWEAEDPQKGLAKLLQRMILRLLNALVVLLAEARAGKLDAASDGAEDVPSESDVVAADADVCGADADRGVGRQVNARATPTECDKGINANRASRAFAVLCVLGGEDPGAQRNAEIAGAENNARGCHPSPSRCAGPFLSLKGRGIRGPVRRWPRVQKHGLDASVLSRPYRYDIVIKASTRAMQ
jgi:hypothetical protein